MSTKAKSPRGARTARAALALSGLILAHGTPASPSPPLAPATTHGDYTVSVQGCNNSGGVHACSPYWIEERTEPSGPWQIVNGQFVDKSPGAYSYRTAEWDCGGADGECWNYYSSSVLVHVLDGDAPRPEALQAQLGYDYSVSFGNIVGDARTEVLVQRTSGPENGNGVVDAVILLQENGGLEPLVPSAAQRDSSIWQQSSVQVSVQDMNADGFADLALRNLADIIPAAKDQIIFASANPYDATPKSVRPLDDSLRQFTENLIDYMANDRYFTDNAPWQYYTDYYAIPYCPYWGYGDAEAYSWYSYCFDVYYTSYGTFQDFSGFSTDAVDIWRDEQSVAGGTLAAGDAAQRIVERMENAIDVSIGGWDMREIFGDESGIDDPAERRGLEGFLAILGIGTAHADEIEPDEAAAQIVRGNDVIYIVGRYVFGSGVNKLHTAVLYNEAVTGIPTWYSAFDSDDRTLFDGTLLAKTRDPRDSPLLMRMTLGETLPPGSQTRPGYFFGDMRAAHEHYRDLPEPGRRRYDAIPEFPCGGCNGRNSNGYVNGLILASGGEPREFGQLDFDALTGWEYPVESHYFGR